MAIRVGIITYTNKTSGIGMFGYDFWKYLGADSILSVASREKGQEIWTKRQGTAQRPPSQRSILEYFDKFKPDVVMFLETPFNDAIYTLAPQRGIKTVAIPMHETFSAKRLAADLLICTCQNAWDKTKTANKELLFLPIGISDFPYKERSGHAFVMNIGYGVHADRRQSRVVVEAFKKLKDPDAKLILYAQEKWPGGLIFDDPRIEKHLGGSKNPWDNYEKGDILLAPMGFEGYGRTVLEGMACGMPVLTTNADPMNLFQHDKDLLIEPCRKFNYNGQWVRNTVFNEVSIEDMYNKLKWLLTIDTPKYSRWARCQAEAQSWEFSNIDYKTVWYNTLEKLCRK